MTNRIVLAIFGLILFFSSASYAEPRMHKPRRFIFLVHGLSGSDKTFGYLPDALISHSKVIQPTEDIRVIALKYDTGTTSSTYQFAHRIAKAMAREIGELWATDRITLIAHSQGGLISWIWYILSLSNEHGFEKYHQMAIRTEGIMTLGSPMWGAKPASFMSENWVLRNAGPMFKMGPTELREMSFGSDTVYRFRQRGVNLDQRNLKLPLRLMAVGGTLYKQDDPKAGFVDRLLLKGSEAILGAGYGHRAETDLAVTIPSARFDFIYMKHGNRKAALVRADQFTNFNFKEAGNFKVVEAPHFGWNQNKFYDMAEVPSTCIDLANPCTHPTFPLILQFTMACTAQAQDCRQDQYQYFLDKYMKTDNWTKRVSPPELEQKELKSIMLDIVMNVPEEYELPPETKIRSFVRFPIFVKDRIYHYSDRSYFFRMDRGLEFASYTARTSNYGVSPQDLERKQIRLTIHGHVYKAAKEAGGDEKLYYETLEKTGFRLPMIIELPGYPARQIEAMVKPSYSTFIDLDYE